MRAACRVRLVTDSQYVKKGITEHLPEWRSNGRRKANGDPILNQDVWEQLDQVSQRHEMRWEGTAGHVDMPFRIVPTIWLSTRHANGAELARVVSNVPTAACVRGFPNKGSVFLDCQTGRRAVMSAVPH